MRPGPASYLLAYSMPFRRHQAVCFGQDQVVLGQDKRVVVEYTGDIPVSTGTLPLELISKVFSLLL